VVGFLGFVGLGLPDGVLGVAWPSMSGSLRVPIDRLGLLLAAATAGYLVSSFWAGTLVARTGVGGLLTFSTTLVVASLAGFALTPAWWPLTIAALGTGLGAGAIDAAINAHAATRFSPRLVTWLHASYGVGAAIGPLVITAVLTSGRSWRVGYAIIAAALACLALCSWRTRTIWSLEPDDEPHIEPDRAGHQLDPTPSPPAMGFVQALRIPAVWLNVALFFLYTGLEVAAGQWSYSLLAMGRSVDMSLAGTAVSAYWLALTGGRVALGFAAGRVPTPTLLRAAGALALLAATLLHLSRNPAPSILALALLGLALAPVYPLLIADTPRRVGAAAAPHAIGFQVAAAYLGAATLPGLCGIAAGAFGFQSIAAILVALAAGLLLLHALSARVLRSTGPARSAPRAAEAPHAHARAPAAARAPTSHHD
jgi:fucose permease